MAYALRYYKEIAQTDGGVVRLEIHKKDSTTSAVEIGAVVQGLSLEIQGQQDDIDTPIQKTSLHMTFVDASDIENGQKNGFWQEFYTPDALLWRVILKAKDAGETSFRTIWGGYVTPDSFSEDLVYRGSVSITARDNIGHMQDFPFDALGDADGLISLFNLVSMGWEKIQSPMDLLWNGLEWLSCNDVIAYHTLMNVSQFKDMNWYKAIETALASYGAVMRYAGENEVYVTTLRHMPSLGRNIDLMDRIDPVFIAGAQRELVPAVKRIEENVEYDLEESVSQPQIKVSDFSGSTETYRCKIDGVDSGNGSFGTLEHDAPIWSINNTENWANSAGKSLFFNPHAYEIGYFSDRRGLGDEIKRFMYIAANNVDERSVSFSKTITCADLAIRIKFGLPVSLNSEGSSMAIEQQNVFNLKSIRYSVSLVQNGVTNYLASHGGWVVDKQEITTDFDTSSQVSDFECVIGMGEFLGHADLTFTIHKIEYAQMSYANLADYGLYACIQDFALATPTSLSLREKNTVNTIYNADNNVILSRDPELGPAFDRVALPAFIKNGIFYRNGDEILPARLWSWGGSEQQMAVWNHLQLLCYYAKPNNLISGTIVNADITRVAAIYEWNHAEHILVSGRYNFLNGHIEGAVLREFARYEDMWSEVAGAAMPETEQDSRSNVESGASSSASPSTYTATQNVNIGTGGGGGTGASQLNDLTDVDVTGVVAQSVLYYNGTSWVDMSFASLINPLLNPYLKAVDADATYATKEVLSGVETALSANISANANAIAGLGTRMTSAESAISDNATNIRNAKGEIDGLKDTKADWGTTLAHYGITDAYTKTEVANELAKYLLLESANQTIKGNITIEGNLVVTGDTASGARGTNSGTDGTLIGVVVNGTRYEDETNGMLDLSTLMNQYALATEIPSLDGYAKLTDIPTTMAWTAITGKPSFASVATSGSYNDLSNKPTIPTTLPASDVYAWAKAATKPSYKTSEVAEETNLYFTNARAVSALADTLKDYVTKTALASDLGEYASKEWVNEKGYITGITLTGDDYISVNGYKLSLAIDAQGGLTNTGQGLGIYQIPSAKIVTDALGYTPLSTAGGELYNGINNNPLTIKGNTEDAYIGFMRSNNAILGAIGINVNIGPVYWDNTNQINRTLIHSGNYSDYALPLSGGTITGSLQIGADNNISALGISTVRRGHFASFRNTVNEMVLTFGETAAEKILAMGDGGLRYSPDGTNYNTLIHSGNYSSYALPKSGGTITSASGDLFAINRTSGNPQVRFESNGTLLGYIGMTSGNAVVRFTDSTYRTLIHSGNIGSYALKTDGSNEMKGRIKMGAYAIQWNVEGYGLVLSPENIFGTSKPELAFHDNTKWHQIAFTDSNVASATKLQTARTIWGQSFDGSGNVNGTLAFAEDESSRYITKRINSSAVEMIRFPSVSDKVMILNRYGIRDGYGLFTGGSLTVYSKTWGTADFSVINGNVLIGTTTDSGYKFDVNGTARVGNNVSGGELLRFNMDRPWQFVQLGSGSGSALALMSTSGSKSFYIDNEIGGHIVRFYAAADGSSITFSAPFAANSTSSFAGAVTMSSTLSVNGQTTINNNLIVAGDTSSGSDIRFKDKLSDHRIALSDIAEAPLFTFRWNDREDDSIHLGSSAQYWEKVAPWLVKGEDFKTLDYSTLGVAIGISLANKTLNLEDRVKILEKENKALKEQIRRIQYGS